MVECEEDMENMRTNRAFKGIWIPKEIWLNTDLTMQEKVFLVEIDSLDNEEGCTAGNQYFANFFGISKTRVSLVIQNLISKGYITSKLIYKEGSKQILYRVLNICRPPYPTFVIEGIQQKLKTPIQQKLKDNNTFNNNTNNKLNNNYSGQELEGEIKKSHFKKPTVDEVKEYCLERGNNINAEQFVDYYEANGWKVGKNSMKDWKATIRTWERRNNEGGNNNGSFRSNTEKREPDLPRDRGLF